jgi:hypothetical protein
MIKSEEDGRRFGGRYRQAELVLYAGYARKFHSRHRRHARQVWFGSEGLYACSLDGKLRFTSEEREVFVIKAGKVFEQIGKNLLGEIAMASPAVSGNVLYYRTRGHLIAIATR